MRMISGGFLRRRPTGGADMTLRSVRYVTDGRSVIGLLYVFPQLRGLDVMKVTLFDCILLNDVFRRVLELFYGGRVIPIR